MGCIARLGCLMLLAILCVAGWFTRGLWMPERYRARLANTPAASWQPITDAGAQRGRDALEKLSQPRGPVFQSLSAGDVGSLAFGELTKRAAGSVDSVAGRIEGDRLSMRASVRLGELKEKLGPAAGLLADRETVELTGTLRVLR